MADLIVVWMRRRSAAHLTFPERWPDGRAICGWAPGIGNSLLNGWREQANEKPVWMVWCKRCRIAADLIKNSPPELCSCLEDDCPRQHVPAEPIPGWEKL